MDLKRMSQDFDVHISLNRHSKSLALQVEGARSGVRGLVEHIASISQVRSISARPPRSFNLYLHKTFIPQEFDLPSPMRIPPDMIERISRLSQAFVEDVSEAPGKVCDTVEHLV